MKITKISTSAQRPANVALFLDVRDGDGQPVAGLEEKNFKVYEDGKLVPSSKAKRALLEPRLGGVRFTLVLDRSERPDRRLGVSPRAGRLRRQDGRARGRRPGGRGQRVRRRRGGRPVLRLRRRRRPDKALVDGLKKFKPRNRNTNLNGAVYQGLFALKEQLDASKAEHKSAALLVFTDRGDLAHSVSPQVLKQAVHDTPAEIYVIGAGEKVKNEELTAIGKSGLFLTDDPKGFKKGFDEMTKKMAGKTEGRYCSRTARPSAKAITRSRSRSSRRTTRDASRTSSAPTGSRPGARPRSSRRLRAAAAGLPRRRRPIRRGRGTRRKTRSAPLPLAPRP